MIEGGSNLIPFLVWSSVTMLEDADITPQRLHASKLCVGISSRSSCLLWTTNVKNMMTCRFSRAYLMALPKK
jgi:hypothetical protein